MQKVNFQGAQSEKGTCDYGDFQYLLEFIISKQKGDRCVT